MASHLLIKVYLYIWWFDVIKIEILIYQKDHVSSILVLISDAIPFK